MFFKIFKQQIYLIIIKVNFFEIIMIFLHFYFFKYDKMTTLLWRYKAYVQVLLVFSLKLFFFNYYQFHDLQFGFVTWIKYYFIEKANGYEACASAWEVPVCFWWCLSIAKITLSSCYLNWLQAIFLLMQHMSA
jgi:hypothetical protein